MLRSCALWLGFAKGRDISELTIQRQQASCGFLPNVRMEGMKQSLALVLSLCVITNTASASLGDNGDQIEDAYGTIVQRRLRDDGTVSVVYTKNRYVYMVTFANNRSISESYSHMKGTEFSEREIMRFLKANSAGATWIPESTGTAGRYERSDGKAEAIYAPVNGRPALTVREFHVEHRRDQ